MDVTYWSVVNETTDAAQKELEKRALTTYGSTAVTDGAIKINNDLTEKVYYYIKYAGINYNDASIFGLLKCSR